MRVASGTKAIFVSYCRNMSPEAFRYHPPEEYKVYPVPDDAPVMMAVFSLNFIIQVLHVIKLLISEDFAESIA